MSPRSDRGGIIGVPPKGDGKFAADLPTGALPAGGPFTEAGSGAWHIVSGTSAKVGSAQEHLFSYTVEIENGVDTAG